MNAWFPWLIALSGTSARIALWFRQANLLLLRRLKMVEGAESQLAASRRRVARVQDDAEARAVLTRSESIRRQAVEHYNDALKTFWVRLPAKILGFQEVTAS